MQELSMNTQFQLRNKAVYYGVNSVARKRIYTFLKRTLDILLSLVMFVVTIPIIIATCVLVVMESEGNPIYCQERLGKNEKKFKVFKIRSMCKDAEKHTGAKWADKNDSRVTTIGKFIRKTRIDELPQLLNILVGDMTIVGPRPERPELTHQFNQEIPGFKNRLQVKPGLTGLAQVNGGYDLTPKEKLEFDMKYIKNRCLSMDIKIMMKTALVVLKCDGAR